MGHFVRNFGIATVVFNFLVHLGEKAFTISFIFRWSKFGMKFCLLNYMNKKKLFNCNVQTLINNTLYSSQALSNKMLAKNR